jgi:hypothetical protein
MVWAKETAIGDEAPLHQQLKEVLLEMPRDRMVRPSAFVAFGPSLAQLKPLSNLPQTSDARVIAGIVRESPHVFFAGSAGRMVSGGVWRSPAGVWWASTMDSATITQVLAACTDARVRVRGFVPSAAVLSHSIRASSFVWHDGDVAVRVSTDNGILTEAVRLRAHDEAPPIDVVAALAEHGEPASIADSWGAACTSPDSCPVLVPGQGQAGGTSMLVVRSGAAALLVALSTAFVLPVTTASIPARRLDEKLAAWRDRADEAEALDLQVRRVSDVLRQAGEFDDRRFSMAALLDNIGTAITDRGVLESASIATGEPLVLTIVSDDMPAILAALAGVQGVTGVATAGSVERHMSEQGPAQRATVRVGLDPTSRRAAGVSVP